MSTDRAVRRYSEACSALKEISRDLADQKRAEEIRSRFFYRTQDGARQQTCEAIQAEIIERWPEIVAAVLTRYRDAVDTSRDELRAALDAEARSETAARDFERRNAAEGSS